MDNIPSTPSNFNSNSPFQKFYVPGHGNIDKSHFFNLINGGKNVEINLCHLANSDLSLLDSQPTSAPPINISEISLSENLIGENISSISNCEIYIYLNKDVIHFNMPNLYIMNDKLPLVLIPYDAVNYDLRSDENRYIISVNNILFEVCCSKIIIKNEYVLLVPMTFFKISDLKESYIIQYFVNQLTTDNLLFTIYCPIIYKNNVTIVLFPEFLIFKRPYPLKIYLDAIFLYFTSTEDSQRKVADIIRIKYGLNSFSHTTISRFLKILNLIYKNNYKPLDLKKLHEYNLSNPIKKSNWFKLKKYVTKFFNQKLLKRIFNIKFKIKNVYRNINLYFDTPDWFQRYKTFICPLLENIKILKGYFQSNYFNQVSKRVSNELLMI
jgi:hypothetical protein